MPGDDQNRHNRINCRSSRRWRCASVRNNSNSSTMRTSEAGNGAFAQNRGSHTAAAAVPQVASWTPVCAPPAVAARPEHQRGRRHEQKTTGEVQRPQRPKCEQTQCCAHQPLQLMQFLKTQSDRLAAHRYQSPLPPLPVDENSPDCPGSTPEPGALPCPARPRSSDRTPRANPGSPAPQSPAPLQYGPFPGVRHETDPPPANRPVHTGAQIAPPASARRRIHQQMKARFALPRQLPNHQAPQARSSLPVHHSRRVTRCVGAQMDQVTPRPECDVSHRPENTVRPLTARDDSPPEGQMTAPRTAIPHDLCRKPKGKRDSTPDRPPRRARVPPAQRTTPSHPPPHACAR